MKYIIAICTLFLVIGQSSEAEEAAPQFLQIEFHVKAEAEAEFLIIMSSINSLMKDERGFQAADVYRHMQNPLHFTLIEKWESYEAHHEHFIRINENGDWAAILQMLEAEPELVYMKRL